MDINLGQKLQLEQKLILTQEMKISLQLLQMPIQELQECIDRELDENPILEIDYDNNETTEDIDETKPTNEKELYDYDKLLCSNSFEGYHEELSYYDSDDDFNNNPFNYISHQCSLKDYIKDQLIDRMESKVIRSICEYLVEFINEDGFITEDIHELSTELNQPYDTVMSALNIIKELQPWGIGARDFRECLLIQLKKNNLYDNNLEKIIMNYLELLAGNKLKELAKTLGITIEETQQFVNVIKSLEPKPTRGFHTDEVIHYIVPEAYLRKIGEDYYIVMNDSILPRLNVNTYYQRIIKEDGNQETVGFMKDKVNGALALIKGIEQRRKTIYRIIEKLIHYQKEYFDKGEAYLKPMTLKDLAVELNLHESTVSRAIKDKYISSPKGTILLKDMFSNGVTNHIGQEDISTSIIKKEIVRLVKAEDKHNPLSDQSICEMLKSSNMNISRRTVAKYREALSILPSGKRKVY